MGDTRTRITISRSYAKNFLLARKRGNIGNATLSSIRAVRGAITRGSGWPRRPQERSNTEVAESIEVTGNRRMSLRGWLRGWRQDAIQAGIDGLRAVVSVPSVA